MKNLIVILAVICISCADDAPCFTCDQMKEQSAAAYSSWQLIKSQKPNPGTLIQATEWYARNEKAKSVYLRVEELVAKNCYDAKYRRDY